MSRLQSPCPLDDTGERKAHPGSFVYQADPSRQGFIDAAAAAVRMAWLLTRSNSGMADSKWDSVKDELLEGL